MKTVKNLLLLFIMAVISSCGKDTDLEQEEKTLQPILVSEIKLDQNEVTLYKEGIVSLKASISPGDAANQEVYWTSSDSNIASVDNEGTVTAHREGEATISVLTADQSKHATCKIVVKGLYRVLFIGNSYTQEGVETHFLNILGETDIRHKVRITWMHKFGKTIKGHSDTYATDKSYNRHRYAPGSSGWTKEANQASLQDVLQDAQYDLVVLQENPVSQEGWMWNNTRKNEVRELMDKITADQKIAPKFACIMGQAYADPAKVPSGYNANAKSILTNSFGGKQMNMYDALAGHTQAMAIAMSLEYVIPIGTALQNLRTSSLRSTHKMDMTTNGVFADLGIGRYVAACTVFESIFTPIFGVNLDDVTYTDNTLLSENTADSKYKTAITAETAAIALKAARLAIKKPYAVSMVGD